MNDQLRKRRIEQPILVRQLPSDTTLDLDPGMATRGGRDKQLRGSTAQTAPAPSRVTSSCVSGARAAADIEHSLTGDDARELGEAGHQRYRIPAHEPVVLIRPSGEAHARNLDGDDRPCPAHSHSIASCQGRPHPRRSPGRTWRNGATRSIRPDRWQGVSDADRPASTLTTARLHEQA